MSFIIITGPTNAGKTTYSKTLEKCGFKVFSFDKYYYHQTEHKSLIQRYNKACLVMLLEAKQAHKGNVKVLCEGPQFLLSTILKGTIEQLYPTPPEFIFMAPSFSQTILNLISRNKGRNRKTKIYFEQCIFSLVSYLYFHLYKNQLFLILRRRNIGFIIIDSNEKRVLHTEDMAYA